MRLLLIGKMNEQVIAASQMAINNGAKVFQTYDIRSAIKSLCNGKGADLIMADVEIDIALLIEELGTARIAVPVIAFGINQDKCKAAKAIKAGAIEYVPFPPDPEIIAVILQNLAGNHQYSNVIFQSNAIKEIIKLAERVASSDASILITGESGTGKEVIAQYIHRKSNRSNKPFIALNCAAIPENLLESELFGHEQGAFTGASERKLGKFEQANSGTLLLDEISEMDIRLQAKLLRALQEREIYRVGGDKAVSLDIRVIATSNRDLQVCITKGCFREDLYYRLNVINLHLPSLRARKEDISPLSLYFQDKYAKLNGINSKTFSPEAMLKLESAPWRGNVRELENTVYRAVLLAKSDIIEAQDIILESIPANDSAIDNTLENIERQAIANTWYKYSYDNTKTAAVLGITIKSLQNKLKQYNISHNNYSAAGR